MTKLNLVLDTHRESIRFTHYSPAAVMNPFDHAAKLVEEFHKRKEAIDADRHLTAEGKSAARVQAGKSTLDAITAWHEPRLKGLDADLLEQRTALIPTTERPDARRIDQMSAHLLKHTVPDIAVFYNSASDDERRVMEAASASVGRVPLKTGNGLEWKTLLDPDMVSEYILARAEETNPKAAQKVRELTEIRAMHVTIASIAASEIRDALAGHNLGD